MKLKKKPKLFIGLEETNIGEFYSPCCKTGLSIEPLCRIACGECGKTVKESQAIHQSELQLPPQPGSIVEKALQELQIRIAYIGMPQEPMYKGQPDWRKWIKLIEEAKQEKTTFPEKWREMYYEEFDTNTALLFAVKEVSTHLSAILNALKIAQRSTRSQDDKDYWKHEQKAHKDYSKAIRAALKRNHQ